MYVMERAVGYGIVFSVVKNDLLSGVTSDERAAVVSVDSVTRADGDTNDWRKYVGMLSDSFLSSLVVPLTLGWPNSKVKYMVTKTAASCDTVVSPYEACFTTSFDTKRVML